MAYKKATKNVRAVFMQKRVFMASQALENSAKSVLNAFIDYLHRVLLGRTSKGQHGLWIERLTAYFIIL
ncbi:hypothetical protein AGMMS50229_08420 [Campylobacterota bacterium]|nr:hypothetical protein AGMMS50229_08390 [Campylobacterota bacterium]GHV05400.1 hypothetical protein AGMMS50229_08420 [Campylobacterota bacterium]